MDVAITVRSDKNIKFALMIELNRVPNEQALMIVILATGFTVACDSLELSH
jgi:hypothetical protein